MACGLACGLSPWTLHSSSPSLYQMTDPRYPAAEVKSLTGGGMMAEAC